MTGRRKGAPDLEFLVSGKECCRRALIGRAPKILGGRGECSGGFGCWGMGKGWAGKDEGKMKNKTAWLLQHRYS